MKKILTTALTALLLVSGCDEKQAVAKLAPVVAAALPAPPMSERAKSWVERLYSTENGESSSIHSGDRGVLIFSRDVLTGSGTCLTYFAENENFLLNQILDQNDPESIRMIPLLGVSDQKDNWHFSQKSNVPVITLPGNGPIRVVANSENQVHALTELKTIHMNGHNFQAGPTNDPLITPLWRAMQNSTQLTIAVDSTTAYTYAINSLPDLVAASEYLCGYGASERVPSWSSMPVSSVDNREITVHDNGSSENMEQERVQEEQRPISQNWILQQDPSLVTVQLSASRDPNYLPNFISRNKLNEPLSIYSFNRNGETWYALLNGLFSSFDAAQVYVDNLPSEALSDQPWIRDVGRIQTALGL